MIYEIVLLFYNCVICRFSFFFFLWKGVRGYESLSTDVFVTRTAAGS